MPVYADRILVNLLSFINKLLFWRAREVEDQPFIKLGDPVRGDRGILQQIRKKSNPEEVDRTVAYWIFMPHAISGSKKKRFDIHLDCSSLAPVQSFSSQPARKKTKKAVSADSKQRNFRVRAGDPTHRISILKADHYVSRQKEWEYEQIFTGTYDLQGSSPYQEAFAARILKEIAFQLLVWGIEEVRWENQIEVARKLVMGHHYREAHSQTDKPVKRIKVIHNRVELDD